MTRRVQDSLHDVTLSLNGQTLNDAFQLGSNASRGHGPNKILFVWRDGDAGARVPDDGEGTFLFQSVSELGGCLQGHAETSGGKTQKGGFAPIRMLTPIFCRGCGDVGGVEVLGRFSLTTSKVAVAYVVMP